MLAVVLFITILMSCIVYLFLGGLASLFPKMFNKTKDEITDYLSTSKSSHSSYKPRDRRVFGHNIGSYSKQCNDSANNYHHKDSSKSIFIHMTSEMAILVKRIIKRLTTKCKQNQKGTLFFDISKKARMGSLF